jgi:hypothetical protein
MEPARTTTQTNPTLTAAGHLADQLGRQLDTAHTVTSHLIDGGPDLEANQPEGQQ